MTSAWIDASAGIAGDMLLGALIDAGADLSSVQAAVDAVVGASVRLTSDQVDRQGQRATKVSVQMLVDDPPHRRWSDVRTMITAADLAERTKILALATMRRLAEAEGRVHGIDPDEVHFHEVGALDSIADVVGCCEAWRLLGIDTAVGSTVAVGAGRVRVAHGLMPVPVPAVAELSLGWPTEAGLVPERVVATQAQHHDLHDPQGHDHQGHDHQGHDHQGHRPSLPGELATPTGMALIRTLCQDSGPQPSLTTTAIGIGAGTKDFPGRPNVVRVLISADQQSTSDAVFQLEANVDDLDPRLWPGVLEALLAAGARDAWLTPIIMKKGRPAHTVHALVEESRVGQVTEQFFATTTTLGVRSLGPINRTILEREWRTVQMDDHLVRIKLGIREGLIVQVQPEFSDVEAAAAALGLPVKEALVRANVAAGEAGWRMGADLDR